MRIGELAERTGVSPRMLRYYEDHGLISSERSAGGQRHYGPDLPERVAMVRMLFDAGLSSRTITRVLPCTYGPSVATSTEAHAVMMRERDRIAAEITRLTEAHEALGRLVATNEAHRATLPGAA